MCSIPLWKRASHFACTQPPSWIALHLSLSLPTGSQRIVQSVSTSRWRTDEKAPPGPPCQQWMFPLFALLKRIPRHPTSRDLLRWPAARDPQRPNPSDLAPSPGGFSRLHCESPLYTHSSLPCSPAARVRSGSTTRSRTTATCVGRLLWAKSTPCPSSLLGFRQPTAECTPTQVRTLTRPHRTLNRLGKCPNRTTT